MGNHEKESIPTHIKEKDTSGATVERLALEDLESVLFWAENLKEVAPEDIWATLHEPIDSTTGPDSFVTTMVTIARDRGGSMMTEEANISVKRGTLMVHDADIALLGMGNSSYSDTWVGTMSEFYIKVPMDIDSTENVIFANGHMHSVDKHGNEQNLGLVKRGEDEGRCENGIGDCFVEDLQKSLRGVKRVYEKEQQAYKSFLGIQIQ